MTITAADLVVMSDNLLRIPSSIELSRATKRIILEKIGLSVSIKIVAVVLAILGEYERSLLLLFCYLLTGGADVYIFLGLLSLWEAVLIDLGTLLVVIFNGMRPLLMKVFDNSNLDKIMGAEPSKEGLNAV